MPFKVTSVRRILFLTTNLAIKARKYSFILYNVDFWQTNIVAIFIKIILSIL